MNDDPSSGSIIGLTDSQYWRHFWNVAAVRIAPSRGGIRDHVRDSLLLEIATVIQPGTTWLEVGCASSTFLLDVPTKLGAQLDGVDISAAALQTTRDDLARFDLKPRLRCHDFATPLSEELNAYDGVVSFGFVEHFFDLAATFLALRRYVKPGGAIVTLIPNMAGLNGLLQLAVDRPIFLTHHIVTPPVLRHGMGSAGLRVDRCDPVMAVNLGVVNVGDRRNRVGGRALEAMLVGTSRAVWAAERATRKPAAPKLWRSPYLIAVGYAE